jgi:hypothetical protein
MGTTIPRIGIVCLLGYGLAALFVPSIVPQAMPPYDKALHFGFFFFAALLAGLSVRSRAGALMFGAILVLGGMLVEVAQGLAGAGRSAEYMDAAVNAAGALTAVILIALLRRGGGGNAEESASEEGPSSMLVRTVRAAYLDARSRNASDTECLRAAVLAYQHFRPEDDDAKARREIVRMIENLD